MSFLRHGHQRHFATVDAEYVAKGKVLLVFRRFPLAVIHPGGLTAAVASECAARQDKFWPLHDRLFARRGQIQVASIRDDVLATGADMNQWDQCMSSADAKAAVDRENAAARAIGIRGTPTFLIGLVGTGGRVRVTKQITGPGTVAEWRAALDQAVSERE